MHAGVLPAVDRKQRIVLKDRTFFKQIDRRRYDQLLQLIRILESLLIDGRHTVRDHQLPDAAVSEQAGGNALQRSRQLYSLYGAALCEGIAANFGQGIREDNLRQAVAMCEGIILHNGDRIRNHDPFHRAELEHSPGDVLQILRQIKLRGTLALVERIITEFERPTGIGDLFELIAHAEHIIPGNGNAFRDHQLLQAAALEHAMAQGGQILGQLQALQIFALGKTVLTNEIYRVRHAQPGQIVAAAECVAPDRSQFLGEFDLLDAAVLKHSLGKVGQVLGKLYIPQILCHPKAVFAHIPDRIGNADPGQLCALTKGIGLDPLDAVGDINFRDTALLEAAPGDLRQTLRQFHRLQGLAAFEAVLTQLGDAAVKLHLLQCLAAGEQRVRKYRDAPGNGGRSQTCVGKHTFPQLRQTFGQIDGLQRITVGECPILQHLDPLRQGHGLQGITVGKGLGADDPQRLGKRHLDQIKRSPEGIVTDSCDALTDLNAGDGFSVRIPGHPVDRTVVRHLSLTGDGQHAICIAPGHIRTAAARLCRKGSHREHRRDQAHYDQPAEQFFHHNSSFLFADSILYHPPS